MGYTSGAKVLFALGLMGLASGACAASFDCNKAKSDIEKLVCKDTETSALDDKLQQAYKTAQAATDAAGKKTLMDEQRHWIAYTRDLCADESCLQQAYTARIAVLARNEKYIVNKTSCEVPGGGGECVNVVAYRDTSIRMHSFNQSITQAKQAGKIIGCSALINLPVGTAGSNNSFGGICTLQNAAQRKVVEICDDDMFGHFEMKPVDPQDVSDKNLIDFTHEHCFGG
ncbi:lysozyme inhibitor LprI family protein [Dyella sp. GSA-30]|uniref:lysozyme inhibitor LprI family protein n=1 Tax=Dyella sp. GSA-30 TaxID=2994496 RepID=UPI00249202E5|nr:lysozyme inhibitor LprI family protein [Dyella sp. GSA-30]BDU22185.1 hypothetical protein DYGSA30_36420 [Dyella sp. GSA-30]